VSGSKRWTTLGPQGTLLLVAGRLAGAATDERPSLKVALVRADQPGVTVVPMPETAFVPEVPHARIQLQDVAIEAASVAAGRRLRHLCEAVPHPGPMTEAFVFDAIRTPRGKGKKDGSLHEVKPSTCWPAC
jgi:alkylation response protein AidB-like acyl-CoA dehydrogenase